MPPLTRQKSKGPFAEGPPGPADHESGTLSTITLSPDTDEDLFDGSLVAPGAHREAIVADMLHERETQVPFTAPSSSELGQHGEQAALSHPQIRAAGASRERLSETVSVKTSDSNVAITPPPMSRRRKPMTTDHEQGGGGGAGERGRKRGVTSLPFRKRVGKASQFESLVLPDESILDYLVSTVARWLERLRDKMMRVLSPSHPQQKGKKQQEAGEESELELTARTSAISRRAPSRKKAHRSASRPSHRQSR